MKSLVKKRLYAIFSALILSVSLSVVALSDASVTEADTAGNVYYAGDKIDITNGAMFGGFGAGTQINITGAQTEDVLALAGNKIDVKDTSVGSSLFAAGNSLSIENTKVNGNIIMAGNMTSIDSQTEANGVIVVSNTVSFLGKAKSLKIAANSVTINGVIDGDVEVEADTVIIGDDAVINGTLNVEGSKDASISQTAKVAEYSFKKSVGESAKVVPTVGQLISNKLKSVVYWSFAMILVAIILMWLFNKDIDNAADMFIDKSRIGYMLGFGAVALVATPIVVVLGMFTFIGIPLVCILLTVYILLLCMGVAFTGASLGRLIFVKTNMPAGVCSILGVVILELVKIIPVIGALVGIFADIYLLGYVVVSLYEKNSKKPI